MRKRSHGEGSYRRLPSGNWSGQVMVGYTEDGRRSIKTVTAPTKGEAKEKIRQYLEDLKNERNKAQNYGFSAWADIWYADYRSEVEESTYWNYSFTLKTLKEHFKDQPLAEIKQLDINRFVDVLVNRNLSKSTISKCKSMLHQIFASAEDNDLISRNPVIRSKKARKANKGEEIMKQPNKKGAFTADEIQIMKSSLPDDLLGNSILTLIGTGLRVQELLALTKDDIAADGSVIRVNKAVKTAYRIPYLGSAKSDKSNREIPVPRAYRPYALYLRENGGDRFVWTSSRESGLYTVEEFRNRYNRVMKKLPGVRYYPPHCCRHTYITNLEAKRVPFELIRALAGHEDVSTTLGYTHISLETLMEAIDAL